MILVGICPECNEILGIKQRALFLECPKCKKTIGVRDATNYLEEMCADANYKLQVIDMCLGLEQKGEIEKALGIIGKLNEKHPHDEQVAYTFVRMSGYAPEIVRQYLETFATAKGEKPFAEEFLDNVMDMRFIMMLPNLIRFAENKLNTKKKRKYLEVLEGMRDDYELGKKEDSAGMGLMYLFYAIAALLNVGSMIVFIFTNMPLWANILIVVGLFAVEFFALFLHNRVYGNRLNISKIEHYFLTVFMASIPIAVGGAVIGWIL